MPCTLWQSGTGWLSLNLSHLLCLTKPDSASVFQCWCIICESSMLHPVCSCYYWHSRVGHHAASHHHDLKLDSINLGEGVARPLSCCCYCRTASLKPDKVEEKRSREIPLPSSFIFQDLKVKWNFVAHTDRTVQ